MRSTCSNSLHRISRHDNIAPSFRKQVDVERNVFLEATGCIIEHLCTFSNKFLTLCSAVPCAVKVKKSVLLQVLVVFLPESTE